MPAGLQHPEDLLRRDGRLAEVLEVGGGMHEVDALVPEWKCVCIADDVDVERQHDVQPHNPGVGHVAVACSQVQHDGIGWENVEESPDEADVARPGGEFFLVLDVWVPGVIGHDRHPGGKRELSPAPGTAYEVAAPAPDAAVASGARQDVEEVHSRVHSMSTGYHKDGAR
jgi:hypothetical protein